MALSCEYSNEQSSVLLIIVLLVGIFSAILLFLKLERFGSFYPI